MHDFDDDHSAHNFPCPVLVCEMVAPSKASRPGGQPLPTPNSLPHIQDLVHADLQERQQLGKSRYGVPGLQPHNGRDMLWDAYEEAMDLCVYLRACIWERDNSR
jgi:hypothetical protein